MTLLKLEKRECIIQREKYTCFIYTQHFHKIILALNLSNVWECLQGPSPQNSYIVQFVVILTVSLEVLYFSFHCLFYVCGCPLFFLSLLDIFVYYIFFFTRVSHGSYCCQFFFLHIGLSLGLYSIWLETSHLQTVRRKCSTRSVVKTGVKNVPIYQQMYARWNGRKGGTERIYLTKSTVSDLLYIYYYRWAIN
jgi:hypothetical protein